MARLHALGGTIITCDDNPTCVERFVTASDKSVHDRQLEAHGWEVRRGHRGAKLDYCAWHRAKPMTMEEKYGPPTTNQK